MDSFLVSLIATALMSLGASHFTYSTLRDIPWNTAESRAAQASRTDLEVSYRPAGILDGYSKLYVHNLGQTQARKVEVRCRKPLARIRYTVYQEQLDIKVWPRQTTEVRLDGVSLNGSECEARVLA